MASSQNLLQLLQSRTIVDCDTMELEVAKTLGPFVDCTSNQAIAYDEVLKPEHRALLQESVELAKRLAADHPGVTATELAVDIAMVKLQYEISKVVTGFVHVQTNPYHSYDTEKTVKDARRIVALFKNLDSKFDSSRVCIKIPSTWEGMKACGILQASGISTLATTLFTIEQAALAGEMGCQYIAPYVNELRVHFDPGFVDEHKAQVLCFETQRYYEKHNLKTQVLPASLTSTAEIMALAGVNHITISPPLLRQLANAPASSNATPSLFDNTATTFVTHALTSYAQDEAGFRIAFTRRDNGEGERKLSQAINIFCDMQTKFEELVK
ncbi:Transaldolase 2 [Phlyctema vagabunda]|uniref:Transaldolase 2 n=1 Tax=Phlyctema vagabunda TaxID=108571 RepID=A0ABR4P6S3_9HELO